MKVTLISYYWKNSRGGGIESYLKNLVFHLNNKNIEASVIFKGGQDPNNFKVDGSTLFFMLKSFSILRNIKPQVIHTNDTWDCLLVGYMYKKFYNVKLVHTFHTEPAHEISKFGKLVYKFLTKGCDSITFASRDLIQKIAMYKGIRCLEPIVTYAGADSIDFNNISPEEVDKFRESHQIKNDSIVLLAQGFTSNRLKRDGAKLLMAVIKNLRDKYPNIVLILTGDGFYLEELKNFSAKISVSENVIFTGFVQKPYIPLKICDVYTHITLSEGGVSLSLLEAMSLGKAIVATSIGGIPEAIEDGVNGLLTDTNEESIAQRIDFLLNNTDIATKLGQNAKKTAEEKFTWGKTVDTFMKLYL